TSLYNYNHLCHISITTLLSVPQNVLPLHLFIYTAAKSIDRFTNRNPLFIFYKTLA
ncbi:unnamed protein product, partial [Musa acuminata var. zebrina]